MGLESYGGWIVVATYLLIAWVLCSNGWTR